MRAIPNQYKEKIDKIVCDIGDCINELRPYILELGESFEMENDDFKVTIFFNPPSKQL